MRNCIACGEQTDVVLGADPDIRGIAVCEKHKDEVRTDLVMLLMDELEEFDEEWFNEKYNLNQQ